MRAQDIQKPKADVARRINPLVSLLYRRGVAAALKDVSNGEVRCTGVNVTAVMTGTTTLDSNLWTLSQPLCASTQSSIRKTTV